MPRPLSLMPGPDRGGSELSCEPHWLPHVLSLLHLLLLPHESILLQVPIRGGQGGTRHEGGSSLPAG